MNDTQRGILIGLAIATFVWLPVLLLAARGMQHEIDRREEALRRFRQGVLPSYLRPRAPGTSGRRRGPGRDG